MDKTVSGSILKTYPSKNKRVSRSYRSSSSTFHSTNVFEDDETDDPFDKLFNDEKKKKSPYALSESNMTITNRKHGNRGYSRVSIGHDRLPLLKNLHKVGSNMTEPASVKKNLRSKNEKFGTENYPKYHSFDNDDDLKDPYVFNLTLGDSSKVKKSNTQRISKRSEKARTEKLKRLENYRVKQKKTRLSSITAWKACSTPSKNADLVNWRCDISTIRKPSYAIIKESSASQCSMILSENILENEDSVREKNFDSFLPQHTEIRDICQEDITFIRSPFEDNQTESPVNLSCDNHKYLISNRVRISESENSNNITCLKIGSKNISDHDSKPKNVVRFVSTRVKPKKSEKEKKIVFDSTLEMNEIVDNDTKLVVHFNDETSEQNDYEESGVEKEGYAKTSIDISVSDVSETEFGCDDNFYDIMRKLPTEEQVDLSFQAEYKFLRNLENNSQYLEYVDSDHHDNCTLASSICECHLRPADVNSDISSIRYSGTVNNTRRVVSSIEDVTVNISELHLSERNITNKLRSFNSSLDHSSLSGGFRGFSSCSLNKVVPQKTRLLNNFDTGIVNYDFDSPASDPSTVYQYETALGLDTSVISNTIAQLSSSSNYSNNLETSEDKCNQDPLIQNFSGRNESTFSDKSSIHLCDNSFYQTVVNRDAEPEEFVAELPKFIPGPRVLELADISPIEKTGLDERLKNVQLRRQKIRYQFSKFESFVEKSEKHFEEDHSNRFESTRAADVTHSVSDRNSVSSREKTMLMPFHAESEVEENNENTVLQNTQQGISVNCTSLFHSIHLGKGKKWRRSFMALKNIIDHRLVASHVEKQKGRLWKQNITKLINNQSDVYLTKELEECSTLKTGFDETSTAAGFEERNIISAKLGCLEKARFSISINLFNDTNGNENEDVGSPFASFLDDIRESLVPSYNLEIQSAACSKLLPLPALDRSLPESAREIVLLYCEQSQPLPFDICFPDSVLENCKKIGEGVYGEVFMVKNKSKRTVLKIIPIEGDQLVNDEKQKKFEEILSELVIAVQLSNLKKRKEFYTDCFVEVQNCRCVYGKYPELLILLWEEYDLLKGSENDSPKMFKGDQLYIVLELDHGGEDVESFKFSNAQQALSVINQVSHALAVAEQAFMFEHRDLHWGNILVTRTKKKETNVVIGNKRKTYKLHGIKVTIIDYTLSRISINNRTLFSDLGKDLDLFIADGDFQFEVYRLMRAAVLNIWDRFVPKTNVYWLYYLLDKFLHEVCYHRDGSRLHKVNINKIQILYNSILNCSSSYEFSRNNIL